MDVLRELRALLWPHPPSAHGRTVRRRVGSLLRRRLQQAPRRGKGARRRRFLEHVKKTARSYGRGLYYCYDDPRIPHTSNDIEGQNGTLKHHLRKVTGRASTAGGPMETAPELLVPAIDAIRRKGAAIALASAHPPVDPAAYAAARLKLARLREPARQYRSIQRNPQKHLTRALSHWLRP